MQCKLFVRTRLAQMSVKSDRKLFLCPNFERQNPRSRSDYNVIKQPVPPPKNLIFITFYTLFAAILTFSHASPFIRSTKSG